MNSGQDMNQQTSAVSREQVSRWMDGDIAPHEVELAMKTLSSDEARYCWAELHFVGDCIRGLEPTQAGCAESIRAAIALEPTIVAPQVKTARQRTESAREKSLFASMRQMGRGGRLWATAAAVAAVGFMGSVVYQQYSTGMVNGPIAQNNGANIGIAASPAINSGAITPVVVNDDFNALLRAHQESADATSLSAVRQYLRPALAVQPQ
jgi:negative regulator of sigma E activity